MKDRFGFDLSLNGTPFWRRPVMDRRLFFRHVGSAVGGYWLMPGRPLETLARAGVSPMATAENVIFILLSGAPSHIDTFDLKEGAWMPAFMEPTSYGAIRFPRGLMPTIAGQMDSVALLRSIKPWNTAHGIAQNWLMIGRNPLSGLARIAPHIGSVVSREVGPKSANRTLPAFVSLNLGTGPANGYFAPEHAPFFVSPGGGGLGNTTHRDGQAAFERRYNLLMQLEGQPRTAVELGEGPEAMAAFNDAARKLVYNPDVDRIFTFAVDERTRYGNNSFGNACITARNLLRANMGTRFIQITHGGWDHHVNIYQVNNNLQARCRELDLGLGTLMTDLKRDGLFDKTLILAIGEFGRTIGDLNVTAGRDHHSQHAALMAGGGIRGGRVIGATDAQGRETIDPGWSRDRDIRAEDLEATIYSSLGIDWTTTLRDDPLGRGFDYVPFPERDLYGPIHELW